MPGRGAVATGSTTFGASITWEDGLKYRNAAIAAITRAIVAFILSGYVSVARFDYLLSLSATHPEQTPGRIPTRIEKADFCLKSINHAGHCKALAVACPRPRASLGWRLSVGKSTGD
jgi:hypothetical protein